MRNLTRVHQARLKIEGDQPCPISAWDTTNDAIIYVQGPSTSFGVLELRRVRAGDFAGSASSNSSLVASWDAPSPLPDVPVDRVLSLQYLTASETICLVFAGGDVVAVKDDPHNGQEKIQIVGSVDAGITAAAWSPDEDILAVTTRENTLLFMTADFDNIASASFDPKDAGLSKQVNVGWGKVETQFKGKGAKALRDPTMPEKIDEGVMSPFDEKQVALSWRGDGAFIAVSKVEDDRRRMIRIISRDGNLESVTEATDGLEGAISWRPSGQLIAGVQRLDSDARLVFFERNGLRHGEFFLRLADFYPSDWHHSISLAWNFDSSVLAIGFQDRVQFWTTSNYHYYLKQEILLEDTADESVRVVWHPEDSLRCLIHQNSNERQFNEVAVIYSAKFSPGVSRGSTFTPNDLGHTAVIDGSMCSLPIPLYQADALDPGKLLFTPLKLANVPPPNALHEILLASNAIDAVFAPSNDEVAVLHFSSVSVFSISDKANQSPAPILSASVQLPRDEGLVPLQLSFFGSRGLVVLFQDTALGSLRLFSTTSASWIFAQSASRSALLSRCLDSAKVVIVADEEAKVLDPTVLEPSDSADTVCTFRSRPHHIAAIERNASIIVFGLNPSGTLLANGRPLMRDCTSFAITETHLLATTTSHLLKFAILGSENLDDLVISGDKPEADELCRSIERGAMLVTVIPSIFAVVLQMPRGNLETIYPRALVLSGIRASIDAKRYKRAFMACRNHRVDMNILHDHAPSQFMNSIELIIEQLKKVEHIDLLLSQLSEENVTQTLYQNPDPRTRTQPNGDEDSTSSKVNRICEAFLVVLQKRYSSNLKNIITANLCKSPPDIEAGLRVILELQKTDEHLVDDAVEHICFLADVNKIYEAALGIYQLDIALLIAQQSQKDPREYLPYLQQLQDLDVGRRRHQIDDDLGRFAKAIEHLYAFGDIGEVEVYAERHELHAEALQLCKYDQKHHDRLMRSYAAYLDSRNRYKDAAVAHESLQDYRSASAAYTNVNMWRESLSSAYLATPPMTTSELFTLGSSLATALEETKDYRAAAQIHHDHLSDVPTAVRLYCRGHLYSEALRTAALHRQSALIPDIIDPGLGEGFGTLSELLADCKGQLTAQVPRLRELRTKREADPLAFLEGGGDASGAADVRDDLSLAGSDASTLGATLMTRYTGAGGATTVRTGASRRTSKNARREERKRARGKKGSVYEEEYLVNSIGRLFERVNETIGEVERTVDGLCRRSMWGRAEALEEAMRELTGMCEACLPEVWEVSKDEAALSDVPADGSAEEKYRPMGGERVMLESIEATKKARKPPVVQQYKGSALLAKPAK